MPSSTAPPLDAASSPSPASRVFELYEIASLILHLARRQFGNSSVIPFTIANKAIGDIALDVLWERQTSLLPLFMVLQRGFKAEANTRRVPKAVQDRRDAEDEYEHEHHTMFRLKPDFSFGPGDWTRLQFYARRIKIVEDAVLDPDEDNNVHFDTDIVHAIFKARPDAVLLPNVYRLELGPRCQKLCELMDFKVTQHRKPPHIPCVSLHDLFRPHALIGYVCQLEKLRSLGIMLDKELKMLPVLRSLPHLEELHLKFEPEDFSMLRSCAGNYDDDHTEGLNERKLQADPAPGFPALTTLRLTDPVRMRCVALALGNIATNRLKLKSLRIRGWNHRSDDPNPTQVMHSAILKRCDPDTLTHLTLTSEFDGFSRMQDYHAMYKDLAALHNITHATLDICGLCRDLGVVLDTLTRAWPRLESLVFFPEPGAPRHNLRLGDLACLANRCPKLSYLSLQVDYIDSAYFPDSIPDAHSIPNRSLVLNIGLQMNLAEKEPEWVSSTVDFLDRVFPYPTLKSITYDELDGHLANALHARDYKGTTPTLAGKDDPHGPLRREWLSVDNIGRILGVPKDMGIEEKMAAVRIA
ncbi:uncharacterized protein SCHCODRAFT_02518768 [Schizophyllum commune H4-8]|uniref:Uncharacterized protein n=1 Tax=Schizophyllum commune (strain H4-8 / FGSC 9210) TaxID=578458 RepID=D8QIX0_SCHCM|nr:uncharacterized protein SCHCODRAFT_02518768 [Schizophyllum commune H4-8]KAI5886198.1 hypothetical protein SCHCODRAFT_02518768 [Schizophyllum commune H4-8]